jgi:hypothetical protein
MLGLWKIGPCFWNDGIWRRPFQVNKAVNIVVAIEAGTLIFLFLNNTQDLRNKINSMYYIQMRAFLVVAAQTGIDAIVDQDTHPLPLRSGLSNKTRKDEALG